MVKANYKQKQQIVKNMELLDRSYGLNINSVKIGRNETFEHGLAKFLLAQELIKNGHLIITEAIFLNKSRADIFVLDQGEAYEILSSETKEMLEKKNYPCKIVPFKAKDIIKLNMQKFMDKKEEVSSIRES